MGGFLWHLIFFFSIVDNQWTLEGGKDLYSMSQACRRHGRRSSSTLKSNYPLFFFGLDSFC